MDGKFIRAIFNNDERTVVESYWQFEDGEIRVDYCPANEDDETYQNILKEISIDDLHTATYEHIKEQNSIYRESIIDIAKEDGLIYDIDAINSNTYQAISKIVFKEFDPEKNKEALFMFKLSLFEVESIKKSDDRESKAKLRKAKSIIEALKIACDIHLSQE